MSDFNDELYANRKEYWTTFFSSLASTLDGQNLEEQDAFYNAAEDFFG